MDSNEVSRRLNAFIDNDLDNYLVQGLVSACGTVRNDARALAPHDTGNLQRSIEFDVDENALEGVIYSNAEYAPYVEIGTGIYSSKGNGRDKPWVYKSRHGFFRTQGNKPHPFMEPALQQNTSKIKDCFKGLF